MAPAKAGSVETLGRRSSAFSRSRMASRWAPRWAITASDMLGLPAEGWRLAQIDARRQAAPAGWRRVAGRYARPPPRRRRTASALHARHLKRVCLHHAPAPPDPPERVRHGLRRPYPAWHVDAPARPIMRLHVARPLGIARPHAGTRIVRRAVLGRRAGRLRRVRRQARRIVAQRGADPADRPAGAGAGDGARHHASRLRRHLQPCLRGPVPVCPPHGDAGSPDARPHRLEHRHRLSGQRRAGDGVCRANGA